VYKLRKGQRRGNHWLFSQRVIMFDIFQFLHLTKITQQPEVLTTPLGVCDYVLNQ